MARFEARPWQPPMLDHMAAHRRCAVLAAMGAGKSVTALTAVANADLLDEGPVLVLGPKRVAMNVWPAEAREWDHLNHLDVSVIVGDKATRTAALNRKARIYTANYDILPQLVDHWKDDWPYRTVVADEITRLKSYRSGSGGSVRAKALARVAHTKVQRFIGLTGTPAPNGYQDLWGQIWFVDKGERLGRSYSAYTQRWFRTGFNGFDMELMPYSQAEIDARIKDIALTIDPKDYGLDIAEPIDCRVEVELPHAVRAQYRQMERDFFTKVATHEIEAANAGVKSGKLRQFASGAVYVGTPQEGSPWEEVHSEKIEALASIIEEANGMPVLVAYDFVSDLKRLLKAFPKARVLDDKKATEDAWNRGEIPVLLAHPASASHGLNLQHGGNIIVEFSMGWNAEYREQIIERIGPLRQFQSGYDRPVYRYSIVAKDTVDEDILLRHAEKMSTQDALLRACKRVLGE